MNRNKSNKIKSVTSVQVVTPSLSKTTHFRVAEQKKFKDAKQK